MEKSEEAAWQAEKFSGKGGGKFLILRAEAVESGGKLRSDRKNRVFDKVLKSYGKSKENGKWRKITAFRSSTKNFSGFAALIPYLTGAFSGLFRENVRYPRIKC